MPAARHPSGRGWRASAPAFTVEVFRTPLSQVGASPAPGSQAKAAAFLLTDKSSYITIQTLRVDGGLTRTL